MKLVLDLDDEGIAGPGGGDGFAGIPFTQNGVGKLGEDGDNVKPGQLVSGLLTNCGRRQFGNRLLHKPTIRALLGEDLHVFEVGSGESLHVRTRGTKIGG